MQYHQHQIAKKSILTIKKKKEFFIILDLQSITKNYSQNRIYKSEQKSNPFISKQRNGLMMRY
ncbi:unnamed protein product [Paramecium pentaurelia]|uniref:Uncharacterized protein n=1 Tax=Paramecium pentaurelia TaxID=43138 RepID=A0A8S1WZE8_9CILI|nr:unnamed protein product [Paramecium pentaurelia]